jgi:hypothetical protein
MTLQLSFDPEALALDQTRPEVVSPRFSPIHVSSSTFKAGLAANIHRWFRLTPSFGPDLVREMLERLNAAQTDYVLDPFLGAGTTAIECSLEGLDTLGFEINPLLHFVGKVSTHWDLDDRVLERELVKIQAEFQALRPRVTFESLGQHDLHIPPIHNPMRWWRPDVLTDILIIKRSIVKCESEAVRDFFRLCLGGVLVPDLTNITLGRLQLHFIDRSRDRIDALSTFVQHAKSMIADIENARAVLSRAGCAEILLQDSTDVQNLSFTRPINCVITSPPYPNRYSYVWNTRPHLFMLDLISSGKAATEIDRKTIGGTWGTATSELMKGIIAPISARIGDILEPIVSEIRARDNLMANYAMHYFNRLARHILSIDRLLSPSARIAYVVGNSWLKDVYVETDVLLGKIFEALNVGYVVVDIHRFRRRHSGKNLFESIVYAKKVGR